LDKKAKRKGIRAKLSIEKWGFDSKKSFTFNQMMKIMLNIRYKKLKESIPTRKLKQSQNILKKKLVIF